MEQHSDLMALVKVTALVALSIVYARFAACVTEPGIRRFLSLLPVLCLLPCLPLLFSFIHLRGISAFFLAWLAVFKLLLLFAGVGPLSADIPFFPFLASATLPVKLLQTKNPPSISSLLLTSATRAALLSALIPIYRFKDAIHPYLLLTIYCIHLYLALELVLACAGVVASLLLAKGLQLERQSDAPYRSSSLQDFWGRRWNIMVSAILRPSVYLPVRVRFGRAAGVLAAFLVSGLMHEIIFWYLTFAIPTGEATAFFVLHGACVVVEGAARRSGWWRPPALVATPLTLGFVAGTGFWLFFSAAREERRGRRPSGGVRGGNEFLGGRRPEGSGLCRLVLGFRQLDRRSDLTRIRTLAIAIVSQ